MVEREIKGGVSFLFPYLSHRGGFTFDEKYYFDPEYKAEMGVEISKWLASQFPGFPIGNANAEKAYSVGIGSPHTNCALFGAQFTFFGDNYADTTHAVLGDVKNLRDIPFNDPREHWPANMFLKQYEELVNKYGPDKVTGNYVRKDDILIHCPLTAAYRLLGQSLFTQMYDDSEGVDYLFDLMVKEFMTYIDIECEIRGSRPNRLFIGSCAATMLSRDLYARFVSPRIRKIAGEYEELYLHSCGPSNHLFEEFAGMPNLRCFDYREQAGADPTLTAKLMPGVNLSDLLSAAAMLTRTPEETKEAVKRRIGEGSPNNYYLGMLIEEAVDSANVPAFFEALEECIGSIQVV